MLYRINSIYLLGRVFPALITFMAISWYTRLVTPQQYGIYALVVLIATVANMGFFQWLRVSVIRLAPGEATDLHTLRSTALFGFVILVVVSGAFGGIAILCSDGETRRMIAYAIPLSWAMAWSDLNLDWLRAQIAPWRYSALYLTRATITVAVAGGLASRGWGEAGLIWGAFLGSVVPGLLFVRTCYAGVQFHLVNRALLRHMFHYGLPLAGSFVLTGLIGGMDRFLLGALSGVVAVGTYAAANDIARSSLYVLMQSVNLGAFPLAIRALEKSGEEAARKQLSDNAVLLALVSFPATAGLIVTAPGLVRHFLDARFHETALVVFGVIALATLLSGWRAFYLDQSFQLGKNTGPQLRIMVLAILVSVATNLLLIPSLGALGAAVSNVITFALVMVTSWLWGLKIFPLPLPLGEMTRIVVATLVMSLVLWPLRNFDGLFALSLQIVGGGLVYALCIFGLNVMTIRTKILQKIRKTQKPPSA